MLNLELDIEASDGTHITTNLSSDQISGRYGDRILDRILAMCIPFKIEGGSYRRKQNAVERARIAQVAPECAHNQQEDVGGVLMR